MKVSEKSLELNVGAELLGFLRNQCGMPKAYLRGLTQGEENQVGVDFYAHMPLARFLAFQFKRPKGEHEGPPYRYTLVREQHDLLLELARSEPASVFYVFPFYASLEKLEQDVPCLARDTWLSKVADMPTNVFGSQRTQVVHCYAGRAVINPEYRLYNLLRDALLRDAPDLRPRGISVADFAKWYERHRDVSQRGRKRRDPWLVRGLRVVVVPTSETLNV